jgi:hypothetical protein
MVNEAIPFIKRNMKSVVCTLFEGRYHLGLAGLVNSLLACGFEGDIFAGYRGDLPSWANDAKPISFEEFPGASSISLTEMSNLIFIPLKTDYHFTNYKPDFMLELWDGPASSVEQMVYLDPDIVMNTSWSNVDVWLKQGVALCEDINSPMGQFHPIRSQWRTYFGKHNLVLSFKSIQYANGGFVGLSKSNRIFLENWKLLQELMADSIGGLNRSSLTGQQLNEESVGIFAPFGKTDQDALNAAVELTDVPASFAGKEAMGFIPGKTIFPHALGTPKPWDNKPIARAIDGYRPRTVDKEYWKYADGMLKPFGKSKVKQMKRYTKIAAFIGRFYNRY